MVEALENFIDALLKNTLKEVQEQCQIDYSKIDLAKIKSDLIKSHMSKEEIRAYVEKKKNELIAKHEIDRQVESGERPSNWGEIMNTVGILFSDENLSSKLSIYGGTIPYLTTGEQPQRLIGDIDTHVSMQDMQQVREIIRKDPDKYQIISDTLQATGKEYGFEMLVAGVIVSVFPTLESEQGMIIRNFHQNELENTMTLVSTTFIGVTEEIESIHVNGQQVRIMLPEFTYITKELARRTDEKRNKNDRLDNEVLKKVIRKEKYEQMKNMMGTPIQKVEVVKLANRPNRTLQEIGKNTTENFSSNPEQEDEALEALEAGVIKQREKKANKTQGEE